MHGNSIYSDEIAATICERLENGETLNSICKTEGYPSEVTVRRWASTDFQGFSAKYAHARELGYQKMADELIEIADDARNDYMARVGKDGEVGLVFDAEHVQRSRLRLDTRKWLLSKALPKVYGDKVQSDGDDKSRVTINIIRYSDGDQPSVQLEATTISIPPMEVS